MDDTIPMVATVPIPIQSDVPTLTDEDIFRGAITAITEWCNRGRYRDDWEDYRDDALAWVRAATKRFEAMDWPRL